MTVSAQFLILYSVALATVSTISTVFFVQTYSLHRRAMNWYGSRIAGINRRWHSIAGPVSADGDVRTDAARPDLADHPTADRDAVDRPAVSAADLIIRRLVSALTPESLTSATDRMPALERADPAQRRPTGVVPVARAHPDFERSGEADQDSERPERAAYDESDSAEPDFSEQDFEEQGSGEQSELGPTRAVVHVPQLQPSTDSSVNPQPSMSEGESPRPDDVKGNVTGPWRNNIYRGRHEAELLTHPTAPFPLVVRDERDGGSRR